MSTNPLYRLAKKVAAVSAATLLAVTMVQAQPGDEEDFPVLVVTHPEVETQNICRMWIYSTDAEQPLRGYYHQSQRCPIAGDLLWTFEPTYVFGEPFQQVCRQVINVMLPYRSDAYRSSGTIWVFAGDRLDYCPQSAEEYLDLFAEEEE